MRSEKLTFRQAQVFQLLKDFALMHGYPPTRQEIADHFKWKSPNAAQDILRKIEEKGFITIRPGKVRAIEILQ